MHTRGQGLGARTSRLPPTMQVSSWRAFRLRVVTFVTSMDCRRGETTSSFSCTDQGACRRVAARASASRRLWWRRRATKIRACAAPSGRAPASHRLGVARAPGGSSPNLAAAPEKAIRRQPQCPMKWTTLAQSADFAPPAPPRPQLTNFHSLNQQPWRPRRITCPLSSAATSTPVSTHALALWAPPMARGDDTARRWLAQRRARHNRPTSWPCIARARASRARRRARQMWALATWASSCAHPASFRLGSVRARRQVDHHRPPPLRARRYPGA